MQRVRYRVEVGWYVVYEYVGMGEMLEHAHRYSRSRGSALCAAGTEGSKLALTAAGNAALVKARGAKEEARCTLLWHKDVHFPADLLAIDDLGHSAALALHRQRNSVGEVVRRRDAL
jgi:hypothetical protein